jgi:sulfite reductase alpha subunit-like flavoprotein
MSLRIAWASESGNSADLLREFIDHCRKQAISIAGIQESNERIKLSRGIWVFFVSTTGQGSPPYSMRPFWKELMKKNYKLESGIAFSIYSLGDSSYGEHFGMTARKLRQRLKMLGAE